MWQVNTDLGTWYDQDQWQSFERVPNAPRVIRYNKGKYAHLAYITEEEENRIKSQGAGIFDFGEVTTAWNIPFFSDDDAIIAEKDGVDDAPMYWKAHEHSPMARLTYITTAQAEMLVELDLYNAGLRERIYYGPLRIPMYHRKRAEAPPPPKPPARQPYNNGIFLDKDSYIGGAVPRNVGEQGAAIRGANVYRGSLSSLGNLVAMELSSYERADRYNRPVKLYRVTKSNRRPQPAQTWNWWSYGPNPNTKPAKPKKGANDYDVGDTLTSTVYEKLPHELRPEVVQIPFSTGSLRQYWYNQSSTNFGANSAIPAITGVAPNPLTEDDGTPLLGMPGNILYYIDLQMQRLGGRDTFDIDHFITVLNQAITYCQQVNDFLISATNCKKPLTHFHAKNISEYATQRWDRYLEGTTLIPSMRRLGKIVGYLADGKLDNGVWIGFGSAGSVMKAILQNGLGDQLTDSGTTISSAVQAAKINIDNIYESKNQITLTNILLSVRKKAVLTLVQKVLSTDVKNLTSLADYLNIGLVAGGKNDSSFATMQDIGKDIFLEHNTVNVKDGNAFADMLTKMVAPKGLDHILGPNGQAVNDELQEAIRRHLPLGPGGGAITILQLLGMSSGYLNEHFAAVNEGITAISKSRYGVQIRDLLTEISRCAMRYVLTSAEAQTAAGWVQNPAPQWKLYEFVPVTDQPAYTTAYNQYNYTYYGFSTFQNYNFQYGWPWAYQPPPKKQVWEIINNPGKDYWDTRLDQLQQDYIALLDQVANDPELSNTVTKLNESWLQICRYVYYENYNYKVATFDLRGSGTNSNQLRMNFVRQLASFGADAGELGLYQFLRGMVKDTPIGKQISAILDMGRNDRNNSSNGVDRSSRP